ncbi:PP2C family protein-serine/threonine phosphatase [Stella sp.]|uniref:PP2C family protein-serine/threonine phosphatase n=1 Tax=Stella sp. TaxID=2912054 RepID=UPI0035AFD4C6
MTEIRDRAGGERRAAAEEQRRSAIARIGANVSVLVVDDHPDNRDLLKRRLERLGVARVEMAVDGVEAVDMIRADAFDLVFLDVMMPNMNGYEVLERLRDENRLADLPVVMISALTEMDSVVRCIDLGAEDYLAKPFNPTLLRARLYALLEKKRLRDAVRENLRRLESDLEAARSSQLGMVPPAMEPRDGEWPVGIRARLEPARQVGGDLIDFFPLGAGHCCFLLGDVSGKGPAAALFMARAWGTLRSAAPLWAERRDDESGVAAMMEAVNTRMSEANPAFEFLTLFLGVLDVATGRVVYSNAGHPPPYRIRRGEAPLPLPLVGGMPVGIDERAQHRSGAIELAPGDRIVVYSDGVTEAMNTAKEFYGDDRLALVLGEVPEADPAALVDHVRRSVAEFALGEEQSDDIAILALGWNLGA